MDEQREVVKLSRAEAVRIMREGAAAAGKPGAKVTDCPYRATGDGTERVRVQAWLRGFLQARST